MPRSDNTICTSGLRPASTAVSHGFAVARYSSPSFGSHGGHLALRTSVHWIQARQLLHQTGCHCAPGRATRSTIGPAWTEAAPRCTEPLRQGHTLFRVPKGAVKRSSTAERSGPFALTGQRSGESAATAAALQCQPLGPGRGGQTRPKRWHSGAAAHRRLLLTSFDYTHSIACGLR